MVWLCLVFSNYQNAMLVSYCVQFTVFGGVIYCVINRMLCLVNICYIVNTDDSDYMLNSEHRGW